MAPNPASTGSPNRGVRLTSDSERPEQPLARQTQTLPTLWALRIRLGSLYRRPHISLTAWSPLRCHRPIASNASQVASSILRSSRISWTVRRSSPGVPSHLDVRCTDLVPLVTVHSVPSSTTVVAPDRNAWAPAAAVRICREETRGAESADRGAQGSPSRSYLLSTLMLTTKCA